MTELSKLVRTSTGWKWLVDGKPFIAYGGELHNSSASNLNYMEEKVWPYVKDLNLNTLLVPIYWEKLEPDEGNFDFSLLEGIISQARDNNMKLILLWFGLWKNGISSYTPKWVKTDTTRFWRAKDMYGKSMDVISPLCEEAINADKKTFEKFVTKVKEIDENNQTVIGIQVQNEIGLLGSDRDYSETAESIYQKEIPDDLAKLYNVSGNYDEAFGSNAPEYFMAYAYAQAVNQIAEAGKKIYKIPYFVNSWIEKYPWRPGVHPSGGPVAKFIPLWQKIAPEIDAVLPDIYVSDFNGVANEFAMYNNPLLIPEHRRDVQNISNVFYAIGKYQALCFAPFGIEDFLKDPESLTGIASPAVMKTLAIDTSAWEFTNTSEYLKKSYEILQGAQTLIEKCREENKVYSFMRMNEHERGSIIETEEYDIKIAYHPTTKTAPKSSGIILQTAKNEFYIIGTSFSYSFLSKKNRSYQVGILDYEEGNFIDGKWVGERTLNGDERYFMRIDMPQIQRVELYQYG
ncbi:DUF5597 domain-containing protein [Metabacillus arenae]|uniref:DUF5597 domain-containing protein n=1 Tax=Metabacillus arenae TaxID=2771434 RepID=A0A926NF88_9BACI|nr:DUF5597 domain-containing protein [Metabacillus arenae]MBD1382394.1 DUF5597 domain-containing protein [Metabacillus arenae]